MAATRHTLLALGLAGLLLGCQQAPETNVSMGAKGGTGTPAASAPPDLNAMKPAPAPSATPRPKLPRARTTLDPRQGNDPARPAAGDAPTTGAAPGSGTPTEIPQAEQRQMVERYVAFMKAASKGDLEGMTQHTTGRFGRALATAMQRHRERLMRGVEQYIAQIESGASFGEAGSFDDGNLDVQIQFGEGQPDHVMFYKEGGSWKLNRL